MSRHQHSAILDRFKHSKLVSLPRVNYHNSLREGSDESEKSLKRQLRVFCGSLIDGVSNHRLNSQTLTISDGTIISISETLPSAAADLDLTDYTCLPGLINTHVHLDANPEDAADYGVYARRTQTDNLALILKNALTTVHTGFTAVRRTGAWFPDTLAIAKAKIDAGEAIGPESNQLAYITIPAVVAT